MEGGVVFGGGRYGGNDGPAEYCADENEEGVGFVAGVPGGEDGACWGCCHCFNLVVFFGGNLLDDLSVCLAMVYPLTPLEWELN